MSALKRSGPPASRGPGSMKTRPAWISRSTRSRYWAAPPANGEKPSSS